jgi:flagellin FlaB
MNYVKDRRGMTGLETAIILVAFVITAAAFSFVIINIGFLTSQKSQSVISSGMTEASSSMLIDSGVVAQFDNVTLGDQDAIYLTELQFYIKLSQGHEPIDIDDSKMVATYTSPRCHGELYITNGTIMTVYIINGDADTLLEPGEKFKIVIDFTEIPKNKVSPAQATHLTVYAKPYETFRVELRPSAGAVLTIERVIPAVYNTLMTLE